MLVKKVKISELPQLQPDVSAEGLFMPAADQNNRTYRVPLSRYDDAKNEATTAAVSAQGAASAAQSAAALASSAANAANAAADAANAAALSTLAKSEPGDYAVTVQGAVKAPPYRRRGEPSNFGEGNIMYRVGGFGATVDLKAYDSGDMKSIISAAAATGDVTVQFNGIYTSGWSGDAEARYTGIVDIHMHSDGSITALALDTARLKRYMLYMPASDTGPGWQSADAGGGEPTGTAGGALTGTYPNPTIKSSVNLPGSPTTTTQALSDNSTKIATTAFVKRYAVSTSFLVPTNAGTPKYYVAGYGTQYGEIRAWGLLLPFIWKNLDRVGICLIANTGFVEVNSGFSKTTGYYTTETVKTSPDGLLAMCIPRQTFIRLGSSYNSLYPPNFLVLSGTSWAGSALICTLSPSMILPFADLNEFAAAESVDIYNLL